jgi:hypothetical protein
MIKGFYTSPILDGWFPPIFHHYGNLITNEVASMLAWYEVISHGTSPLSHLAGSNSDIHLKCMGNLIFRPFDSSFMKVRFIDLCACLYCHGI